jgi:hypothetical protein
VGADGSKSMVDFRSNEADRIAPGSGEAHVRPQPAPGDQRPFNPLTSPSRGKLELRYGLRETL